jgi:imidazolonepropionase
MLPALDLLLEDASEIVTGIPGEPFSVRRLTGDSIAIANGRIEAIGPGREIGRAYDLKGVPQIDCRGKVLAPGFVDAHTHVVFGGSRVKEYALRMTHSPAQLRETGLQLGISASVAMTREAPESQLLASAAGRLERMLASGTTTAESKSGYGLSLDQELKMLQVNRQLQKAPGPLPRVVSTFLGAHAFPADLAPDAYVDLIVESMIPAVASRGLAQFCDAYIDQGYFDLAQTHRILSAAQSAGMKLKIHADQYSALGGAELAAEMAAVSADHLNYTTPQAMRRLAEAGVVGVLMPLIDFAVRHPQPFDARSMMDAGMTLALATDICPGGWTESMQLVMQFACRQHGFSPEEALFAATGGGALALDLHDRGFLSPGYLADVQIWDLPSFEDVIYRLGHNALETVILGGVPLHQARGLAPS